MITYSINPPPPLKLIPPFKNYSFCTICSILAIESSPLTTKIGASSNREFNSLQPTHVLCSDTVGGRRKRVDDCLMAITKKGLRVLLPPEAHLNIHTVSQWKNIGFASASE